MITQLIVYMYVCYLECIRTSDQIWHVIPTCYDTMIMITKTSGQCSPLNLPNKAKGGLHHLDLLLIPDLQIAVREEPLNIQRANQYVQKPSTPIYNLCLL